VSVSRIDTPEGKRVAGVFRRMFLDVLADNPGWGGVEKAYLMPYKEWLKSLVEQNVGPPQTNSAQEQRLKDHSEQPGSGL
jgi:hypothetical protein